VNAGFLYNHLWSKTRETGYSIGETVRLESALDLVKKMGREKERSWREPRNESMLKKASKVGSVSIYISSNSLAKALLTNSRKQLR